MRDRGQDRTAHRRISKGRRPVGLGEVLADLPHHVRSTIIAGKGLTDGTGHDRLRELPMQFEYPQELPGSGWPLL